MATNALEIFNSIVGNMAAAQAAIEKMIADKVPENNFLEYKSADKFDYKDAKEIWSKALSGFANTDGGVLIWGVHCRKTDVEGSDVKLDVPTGEPGLHANALKLKEQLADLVSTATIDFVERVRIEAVPFDSSLGGCVVCYIPEGKNKPYRAMFANQAYYQRLPDRMAIVPHALLRTMFYPVRNATISIEVFAYPKSPETLDRILFVVEISNVGNASADDVFVKIESNIPVNPTFSGEFANWDMLIYKHGFGGQRKGYGFYAKRPIHPTSAEIICEFTTSPDQNLMLGEYKIDVNVTVFVRDGEQRKHKVEFYPRAVLQTPYGVRQVAMPIEKTGRAGV